MDKYAKNLYVIDLIYAVIVGKFFAKNIFVNIKFRAIIEVVKIPPIEFLKYLNILSYHFTTSILLELIISSTPPTILSKTALSLITSLFVISLNLQLQVAVISSKLIPSI